MLYMLFIQITEKGVIRINLRINQHNEFSFSLIKERLHHALLVFIVHRETRLFTRVANYSLSTSPSPFKDTEGEATAVKTRLIGRPSVSGLSKEDFSFSNLSSNWSTEFGALGV